jgi:two-component system response regulator
MCAHLILLAENERDVCDVTLLALAGTPIETDVVEVHDGEAVLDFFLNRPANRHAAPCDLMFLGLALPKLDGLRVLRQLRWLYRDDLSELPPIVILSDSDDEYLIAETYRHGADGFLIKEPSVPRYCQSIQETVRYWLKVNVRPAKHRPVAQNPAVVPGGPIQLTAALP